MKAGSRMGPGFLESAGAGRYFFLLLVLVSRNT
jgi:hypothetical protein